MEDDADARLADGRIRDGTGASFGAQVVRYSFVGWLSLTLGQVTGLAVALVLARQLGFGGYGRFALLTLFAAMVTLVVRVGAGPGTMNRVFGVSDDEDEDDEDPPEVDSTKRSLGTGLVLSTALGGLAVAASVPLAGEIGEGLLDGADDRRLIVWAALAGSAGAVYELACNCVWMERRPAAFARLAGGHAVLTLVAIVTLVAAGAGLEGAIAGLAIGTALATAAAVFALRDSFELVFDRGEALAILRRGPTRLPIVGSFWTLHHGTLFVVSRFVSTTDVGAFHLAGRFAIGIASLAGAVRLALRPLMRTTFSTKVDDRYGASVARGLMLTYFTLATIALVLATALAAHALEPVVSSSYAVALGLIPLFVAAQLALTSLQMLSKLVLSPGRRRIYVRLLMTAAALSVVFSLLLIPWLGLEGAPIAMLAAFAAPITFVWLRSQRGRRPLAIAYRPLGLAALVAAVCGLANAAIPTEQVAPRTALAFTFFGGWLAAVLVAGAVPRHQRRGMLAMLRAAARRGPDPFDVREGLHGLDPHARQALKLAILAQRPFVEIAPLLRNGAEDVGEHLTRLVRHVAEGGGRPAGEATETDGEIGRYLFSSGSIAARSSMARRLLRSGVADAADLHDLETVVELLASAPPEVWAEPQTS